MPSTDAGIHAAQHLFHKLQNISAASPLVTIGNTHKEALITLAFLFDKSTSLTRSLMVVHPEQQQPIIGKFPYNNAETLRVPIVETYS